VFSPRQAAAAGDSYNFSLDCPKERHYNFPYSYHLTGEGTSVMTAHQSDTSTADAAFARLGGVFRLLALLPAGISLAISAPAWGDIYKWTDEQGRINISNVPPPSSVKAKNIEVVLKEAKSVPIPQHVATPTEQALLARIESLERQLQTRQYAPPVAAFPPSVPNTGYYPSTPPPPPPGYYGTYTGYYPSYSYPVPAAYAVYSARAYAAQPIYLGARSGFTRGGGHRGRR
jgi:hypothetical protein